MRILARVENSVIWLQSDVDEAITNLRREAGASGIDPQRLIFAPRMPNADHLARYRRADLFLDTYYFNAHTTGSDALWVGLPMLTQLGNTFAGRVAASLNCAVGMNDLVVTSPSEYEALAVRLATHPEHLDAIRKKLAENKCHMPLFNTSLYTRRCCRRVTQVAAFHDVPSLETSRQHSFEHYAEVAELAPKPFDATASRWVATGERDAKDQRA